ncbi:MAG: bifunctional UDP-N-acetylglucosamine diphosphorylase/glucosamine-1-phosphate N-acetyltransferase GlmU, partial [Rhizobiaceae bacterium]
VAVVVGRDADLVRGAVAPFVPDADAHLQSERLGTAHAVLAARSSIARGFDDVVVLFGDTPLVSIEAVRDVRAALARGAAVAVMGFQTQHPAGYGRLITQHDELLAIREDKDCTPEERQITFCNGGAMAISGDIALDLLDAVGNANAKGEYYLTDIVEIARARGMHVAATLAPFESVLGVNTRVELAEAEAVWQARKRREMMLSGVTLLDPASVHFSWDTEIGADTIVEPQVFFGPGVKVDGEVTIHGFSHLERCRVGAGAEIGPYARLRPDAEIGKGAKVGNFVEIKKSRLGEGAKANHLSYIGDADIGPKANIGAGTITCNYDGFLKHKTIIGAGAFIGSNSSLVAPVHIADNAYVGSGSVITKDVPADALGIGRARQANLEGKGKALRDRLSAARKAKSGGG